MTSLTAERSEYSHWKTRFTHLTLSVSEPVAWGAYRSNAGRPVREDADACKGRGPCPGAGPGDTFFDTRRRTGGVGGTGIALMITLPSSGDTLTLGIYD
jgi:hypothetical protein